MPAPCTFLVAQSNLLDRARSTLAVRRAGAIAVTASSIAQAKDRLDRHGVDIALLDLDAAACSPYDLLAHIQTHSPSTYTVAISASMPDSELEQCFARGFDDFLAKPMRSGALRVVIDAANDARNANIANGLVSFTHDADIHPPELRAQLFLHLRDETDKLYAVLSNPSFMRALLRRKMHRIRSGLLLLGLRSLADECLDLERDCELETVDEAILHRRGWRLARQMRALSST